MHLFEFIYYLGFSAKKRLSLKERKHLPSRVISIGNITLGGTGKTPAVIALAEQAKIRGFKPIILTRGYKGRARGPCFVTRGERPLLSAAEAGDEPRLMAEKLDGVPIVKSRDRYEAGIFALREIRIEPSLVFILDDGFQHFRLHRDKDILLLNGVNPFGNRMMLPFGPLREPVKAVCRAQMIVLTNVEKDHKGRSADLGSLMKEIRKYNREAPVFFSRHVPVRIRLGSGEERPVEVLSGKKVFAFCGLARPDCFLTTIRELGAEIEAHRFYRDHYAYRAEDLVAVKALANRCGAEWIVTTEKDIMKLGNIDLPENIFIIEVEFSVEGDFYDKVFAD